MWEGPDMKKELLLRTEDLNIGYKKGSKAQMIIATGLKLEIFKGELVCLVGPNGVGKSTLLRTLAGLHDPLGGRVILKERDISSISSLEMARIQGLVLTEKIEMEGFNVFDMIALGRFPHTDWKGYLTGKDHRIIAESLQLVRGEDLAERKINELSDGERQKVMIARALAQEPELIFLDEPTSFLDLLRKVEVVRIMRELARNQNKAVVMALHDIPLALQYADRLWLFEPSGTIRDGAPEDLVLSGKIVEIFSSDPLIFDPVTGSYPFYGDQNKQIVLKGAGLTGLWTRKALEKEGYSVTEEDLSGVPLLEIINRGNSRQWHLSQGARNESYSSIYDMLRGLRNIVTDLQA